MNVNKRLSLTRWTTLYNFLNENVETFLVLQLTIDSSRSSATSVVLENLRQLRRDAAVSELKSVLDQFPELAHEAGIHLVQRMTPRNRQVGGRGWVLFLLGSCCCKIFLPLLMLQLQAISQTARKNL